jgi:hypothetical protein
MYTLPFRFLAIIEIFKTVVIIYTTYFNIQWLLILIIQYIYDFLMIIIIKIFISLNSINQFVFVMKTRYVFFEVRFEF